MIPEDHMIHVYQIPKQLSNGYCFGSGVPITFNNVDWFNSMPGLTPDHVRQFVAKKRYIIPGCNYLILCPTKGWAFYLTEGPQT